jgi:hypothetical protein
MSAKSVSSAVVLFASVFPTSDGTDTRGPWQNRFSDLAAPKGSFDIAVYQPANVREVRVVSGCFICFCFSNRGRHGHARTLAESFSDLAALKSPFEIAVYQPANVREVRIVSGCFICFCFSNRGRRGHARTLAEPFFRFGSAEGSFEINMGHGLSVVPFLTYGLTETVSIAFACLVRKEGFHD